VRALVSTRSTPGFTAFSERDRDAYERMLELTGGNRTVPVIVERGKPVQVGWMGQGCFV
jgi:glutaredoxin 3